MAVHGSFQAASFPVPCGRLYIEIPIQNIPQHPHAQCPSQMACFLPHFGCCDLQRQPLTCSNVEKRWQNDQEQPHVSSCWHGSPQPRKPWKPPGWQREEGRRTWRCCGSSPANVHECTDVSREHKHQHRGCYRLSPVPGASHAVGPSPAWGRCWGSSSQVHLQPLTACAGLCELNPARGSVWQGRKKRR